MYGEDAVDDAALVEVMAEGAYEQYRVKRLGLPPWSGASETYRDACLSEMRAAVAAARKAGFRINRP